MREPSGVASDNLQDSNHRRLGASAEGRRAWPQAPSPSGHICRPPRPQGFRVAFPRAPVIYFFNAAATFGILAKVSLSAAFSRASSGLTVPASTSFASTASMLCIP